MKRLFVIIFLITVFSSCSDQTISSAPGLYVYIEDSPADYDGLDLDISSFAIYNGAEWVKLKPYQYLIELLTLTGGESLQIVAQEIPPGDYTKFRLVFNSGGQTLFMGSQAIELTVDEEFATVDVPVDFKLTFDNQAFVMLDMDASQSVDLETRTLKPVIRSMDLQKVGVLKGAISDEKGVSLAEAMLVEVTSMLSGEVRTTYTNAATSRLFMRLDPGQYSMKIIPFERSTLQDTTVNNIVIQAQEVTSLGAIQLKTK